MSRAAQLFSQVEVARVRVADLNNRAIGASDGALVEVLEELSRAFEELRVAEEEITRQTREATSAVLASGAERRRYQELIEFLPDAYFVTDINGMIREANEAACELAGAARASLESRPLTRLAPEADRREWRRRIRDVAQGSGKPVRWDARVLGRGGVEKRARVHAVTVVSGCLGAVAIRWLIRDQSAEVELQEEAHTAQERASARDQDVVDLAAALQRSNREWEALGRAASRELAEPLRDLAKGAAVLREEHGSGLDETGRQRVEAICEEARRLSVVVDAVAEFASLWSRPFRTVPTDLSEVVREVLGSLETELASRGARVEVETDLPTVSCDRERVATVFRNLIRNAATFSASPQKRVRIGAVGLGGGALGSGAGDAPVLYVKDNGIGIAQSRQQAVFEPFRRLHARESFGGGAGLGLSVVKRIVEWHGGRIWIESAPGQGTTFFFTLGRAPGTA